MSKKDSKKDVSQVEEVDLSAMSPDGIFDLGKIREKAATTKEVPVPVKNVPLHDDEEEDHSHDHDVHEEHHEEHHIEDDLLLPLKDDEILLFTDDAADFDEDEDEDEDEDDEDEEGVSTKKKER